MRNDFFTSEKDERWESNEKNRPYPKFAASFDGCQYWLVVHRIRRRLLNHEQAGNAYLWIEEAYKTSPRLCHRLLYIWISNCSSLLPVTNSGRPQVDIFRLRNSYSRVGQNVVISSRIIHIWVDGYWVEDHERDLIRVQSLSLRTTKDQGSLTKERDRRESGEGTRAMELRMTRTRWVLDSGFDTPRHFLMKCEVEMTKFELSLVSSIRWVSIWSRLRRYPAIVGLLGAWLEHAHARICCGVRVGPLWAFWSWHQRLSAWCLSVVQWKFREILGGESNERAVESVLNSCAL